MAEKPSIHRDLLITYELLYNPCGFHYTQPQIEEQNAEYGASLFHVNAWLIRYRVAKVTPKKEGQFVTMWHRNEMGISQPYDESDTVDYYVISTRKGDRFGQFVFPKAVLVNRKVLSVNGKDGKRAIRVYPAWDNPNSRQAKKTQAWQLDYFLEIPADRPINQDRAAMLYRDTKQTFFNPLDVSGIIGKNPPQG